MPTTDTTTIAQGQRTVSPASWLTEARVEEQILLKWVASSFRYGSADAGGGIPSVIDWKRLRSLALYHGVLPTVARAVLSCPTDIISDEVRSEFRRDAAISTLAAQANCLELIEVVTDLQDNGIVAVAFKGPALSKQAYGDYLVRKPGDIDLLVARRHFDRARGTLLDRGYRPRDAASTRPAYRRGRGSATLERERFSIDLHWTLQQESYDSLPNAWQFDTDEIVGRSVELDLAGNTVRSLSREDHLEFLCLHGAKDSWSRLVMISDLAALVSATPDFDWDRLRNRRRMSGYSRVMDVGICLASSAFHTAFPHELVSMMKADQITKDFSDEILKGLFAEQTRDGFWAYHAGRARFYRGRVRQAGYIIRRARRKLSKLTWGD